MNFLLCYGSRSRFHLQRSSENEAAGVCIETFSNAVVESYHPSSSPVQSLASRPFHFLSLPHAIFDGDVQNFELMFNLTFSFIAAQILNYHYTFLFHNYSNWSLLHFG